MANDIVNRTEKDFESIKHKDENGAEFWYARELMQVLEYSSWDKFKNIIKKAMIACENSQILVEQCFSKVGKTSKMPKCTGLLRKPHSQRKLNLVV